MKNDKLGKVAEGRSLHIAISGDLGSGKSAVAESVAHSLGRPVISTGAIQRQIAKELNLSTLETNLLAERDREIDKRVDDVTRELGRNESQEPIVFDSRMAWYMLRDSFKVRLVVDPAVAVSRIMSRGSTDVESYRDDQHAEDDVRLRYESEIRRFLARYGVDVTATKHFNLVLDSSDLSVEQVSKLILESYHRGDKHTIIASPRRMLPARREDIWNTDSDTVDVVYSRPFWVVIGGLKRYEEAIANGEGGLAVNVVAEGLEEVLPGLAAADYVRSRISEGELAEWSNAHGLTHLLEDYRNWRLRHAESETQS